MNEEKIKELFELCLRVSNETTAHVNFDYTADDDMSVVLGQVTGNLILMQNYQHRIKPTKVNSTKRNSGNVLTSEESAKQRERFLDCKQELTMHRMKRQNSHYSKTLTESLIFYRNKMLHTKISTVNADMASCGVISGVSLSGIVATPLKSYKHAVLVLLFNVLSLS